MDAETKLHEWLTKVWNERMAESKEPMWILTDELIRLLGSQVFDEAL